MGLEGGLVVPVALGLIAMGPRYLPAPQVGLSLLLKTILGPLWVWVVLWERPTDQAVIGGLIVLGDLLWHGIRTGAENARNGATATSATAQAE